MQKAEQYRFQSYLKAFNASCSQCFLNKREQFAYPVGDVTSELLMFGETPSASALKDESAFPKEQLEILEAVATMLGYDSFFASNFVACRPSKTPIYTEYVDNCMLSHVIPFLKRGAYNTHSIIVFGRNAFKIAEKYIMAPTVLDYLPGRRVGIFLFNKKVDIYSLYHPASLAFGKISIDEYKEHILEVRHLIDRRRLLYDQE